MENNIQHASLGYTKKLCILPFDHRSFFVQLLGFTEPLTDEQKETLVNYKKIIYKGYEKSLTMGTTVESTAILVDDAFGMEILLDAKQKGYNTLQSTEVSGMDHFEFDHGENWKEWIDKVKPTFVKVLVRYNVAGDRSLNEKSIANLKIVSEFAHSNGYKFLIEPLVPATQEQLTTLQNNKARYDHELRPELTVKMITEMQDAGVEPDVWKIEGMYTEYDYAKCVMAAQREGRTNVGIVSLGRNETDEVVETWLKVGAKVPGVIGFAVGRTIFLDSLMKYRKQEMTESQAIDKIAERFLHFYKVFNSI